MPALFRLNSTKSSKQILRIEIFDQGSLTLFSFVSPCESRVPRHLSPLSSVGCIGLNFFRRSTRLQLLEMDASLSL